MIQRNDTCTMTEENLLQTVRHYIRQIAESPVPGTPVDSVLTDALGSSGKMIRPQLLLTCAALGPDFSEKTDRLCILAAMVELTHLSSLIHDDIVDEAPLRRGAPSIQSKYGKDAAVYAGDFLIARIQYWQAREALNHASMRLARTVEEMCIGEIGQAMCRYHEDTRVASYYQNINGKTASLFKCACAIGAAEAGCSDRVVETLEQFGQHLGIMFQLRDDLSDFTATRQEIGKETHKDFRDGIYTLPVLLTMESPAGRAALLPIMQANAQHTLSPEEIGQMEQIVCRFGGVEATWEEIHRHCAEGHRLLDTLEKSASVETLRKMLERLNEREE